MHGCRPFRALGALVVAIAVAGCSSGGSDASRFCEEIAADPSAILTPALGDAEELEASLEHFRDLDRLAPVAIAAQWRSLVDALETATTVVVTDPDSVKRTKAVAYATERSAVEINAWIRTNCGVDLGPVATIADHGPVGTIPEVPLFELAPDGSLIPIAPPEGAETE